MSNRTDVLITDNTKHHSCPVFTCWQIHLKSIQTATAAMVVRLCPGYVREKTGPATSMLGQNYKAKSRIPLFS